MQFSVSRACIDVVQYGWCSTYLTAVRSALRGCSEACRQGECSRQPKARGVQEAHVQHVLCHGRMGVTIVCVLVLQRVLCGGARVLPCVAKEVVVLSTTADIICAAVCVDGLERGRCCCHLQILLLYVSTLFLSVLGSDQA